MDYLNDIEKQMRGPEDPSPGKPLLTYLMDGILSESALKDLAIKTTKKYMGPIREGVLGEIYGPRGIGKSWLSNAIAICLSRGLDLGPLKSETPAGVLIVDGEMALNLIKDRQPLTWDAPAALRPMDMISNEYLYQEGSPVINLAKEEWRDAFLELMGNAGERWDVIIFDNLSSFLPGVKENDQESWAPINGFLLKLRWMGKAVIFIHHAGKSGDQRGTSGREDQLDFVLKLTLPPGHDPEEGCRFDATFTKSRSLTGAEAAPFTFAINTLPSGALTWTVTNQKESRKEIIIALLGNGTSQKDIADIMAVGKSYVSQVRKSAIDKGLLNSNGTSFTPAGQLRYGDVDIEKYSG